MDNSAITNLFEVVIDLASFQMRDPALADACIESEKAPSRWDASLYFTGSYTISAKCSTRRNKERKDKESCATKTESHYQRTGGCNGPRNSSQGEEQKGGAVRQNGIRNSDEESIE